MLFVQVAVSIEYKNWKVSNELFVLLYIGFEGFDVFVFECNYIWQVNDWILGSQFGVQIVFCEVFEGDIIVYQGVGKFKVGFGMELLKLFVLVGFVYWCIYIVGVQGKVAEYGFIFLVVQNFYGGFVYVVLKFEVVFLQFFGEIVCYDSLVGGFVLNICQGVFFDFLVFVLVILYLKFNIFEFGCQVGYDEL